MAIYVAIEGIDGAGKSAVAAGTYQNLLQRSEQRNHLELISHTAFAQSSSYLARTIGRKTSSIISYGEQKGFRGLTFTGYLLSLFPYLLAKRAGKRKGIIISDRSPWVTGQVYVAKVSETAAKVIMPFLKFFMERPDYLIYLHVESDVAQERAGKKGSGQLYHSRNDLDELARRYDAFVKMVAATLDIRVFSIDTSGKSIEAVCEETTTLIAGDLQTKVQAFIREMKSVRGDLQPREYANVLKRVKDEFSVESLKIRLAHWYKERKIDGFDGADVLNALNKNTVQYILGNLGLFVGLGALTPTGIGSFISCPVRFLWTVGNRVYWTVKGKKDKARIHGLDIAIISAIPGVGSSAHLLSLYRENHKLYALVKEHCIEYILGSKFRRGKK